MLPLQEEQKGTVRLVEAKGRCNLSAVSYNTLVNQQ